MRHINTIKRKFIPVITVALFLISCGKGNSEIKPENNIKKTTSSSIKIKKGHKINIYYFHTTYRCYSCNKIEQLTKEVLAEKFSSAMRRRSITFKSINIEKSENKHFIQDYKLFTKTVVLSDIFKGKEIKWERLDKTWNHLRDRNSFFNYMENGINSFIEGNN